MANFHVYAAGSASGLEHQTIRHIGAADVFDALCEGFDDFWAKPSHYVFLCLIYPLVGAFLIAGASGDDTFHMIFPLMSGFALLGPLAGIGIYEISRRRELGLDTSWWHALEVRKSPAIPSIVVLGLFLMMAFIGWLLSAQALYDRFYGSAPPADFTGFIADVFSTERGRMLMVAGSLVGLVFALIVLATTVIAFPLLLDRDVGVYVAVETSVRATFNSPVAILLWGLIVAVCLAVGSVLLFAGLAVALPVLGHATWHLYRKLVPGPTA
jgi:uncharacterized membrane protein